MTHLENAVQFLAIAEGVYDDPAKARKAAYKSAAEEFAAHKDETGDSTRVIADSCKNRGHSINQSTIVKLLKWRASGYKAKSPFLMDEKATSRARTSHAKSALKNPSERKTVLDSLTEDEQVEVARDILRDPEVTAKVVADKKVREAVDVEEKREYQEAAKRRKEANLKGRKPTPLSQFYWRIVSKIGEWTRNLNIIEEESDSLAPHQHAEVISELSKLRDKCQRCIDKIEGNMDEPETIEGKVVDIRERKELTAS
jgi:hypothetical protein